MFWGRLTLLAAALCCAVPCAQAQRGPQPRSPSAANVPSSIPRLESFYLGGRILYAENMKFAPQVPVKLLGSGGALVGMTFSNDQGQFEFHDLRRAVYLVEVAEEGYEVVRERVDLYLGSRYDTVILLKAELKRESKPSEPTVSLREMNIPAKARKAFENGLRELHEKGRPGKSLAHFRKAIEIFPDYDEAYVQLGLAHLQAAQLAEAEQVLHKALAIYPGNARAGMLLGTVYNQQGRPQDAVGVLQEAVKISPDAWQVHFELGRAFLELGNLGEGYRHARRAHELKAEVPGVHLLVYNMCIARQDYETALQELEEFLRLYPDNALGARVRQQRDAMRESMSRPQE